MSPTVIFVLFLAAAQGGGDNIGRESTTVDFSWTCDFSTSRLLLGGDWLGGRDRRKSLGNGQQAGQNLCCLRMRTRLQSEVNSHTKQIHCDPFSQLTKTPKKMSEELTPLRFSQFPGVPPFLNYIVGPEDCPIYPPPILRSLIKQPISVSSWPRCYVNSSWNLQINGTACKFSWLEQLTQQYVKGSLKTFYLGQEGSKAGVWGREVPNFYKSLFFMAFLSPFSRKFKVD